MAINYTFPPPNVTQSQDMVNLMRYLNEDILGNTFGLTILFVIFVVIFITAIGKGKEEAFMYSSTVTALVSYLFYAVSFVEGHWVLVTTVLMLAAFAVLYRSGK